MKSLSAKCAIAFGVLATAPLFAGADEIRIVGGSFEAFDVAVDAVRTHVVGDWTFYFRNDGGTVPTGNQFYFQPVLPIYFEGPNASDQVDYLNVGGGTVAFADFLGLHSYSIHVDETGILDDIRNVSGHGEVVTFFFPPLGSFYDWSHDSGVSLQGVEVNNLEITLTGVIPEPTSSDMAIFGLAFVIAMGGMTAQRNS